MSDPAAPSPPKAPLLRFEPSRFASSNYSLEPAHPNARIALDLILCMGSLQLVADAAHSRTGGYGNTDFGIGLDGYPTRPDRAGMVRWWRWDWVAKKDPQGRETGQRRVKTRKFHLPEATYMGVLAGVLREHGWLEDAAKIEAMLAAKQAPAEQIAVRYAPDIFALGNYRFTDHAKEYHDCLGFILELKDLEWARALALKREGYAVPWAKEDKIGAGYRAHHGAGGKVLSYGDGTLTLRRGNATPARVSEAAYLDVLEQLLTLHRLPSLRGNGSPHPAVLFRPRVQDAPNYHLAPRTKANAAILETLLAFPWLEDVAKQVLQTQPHPRGLTTHEGHGFLFQEQAVALTHRHGPRGQNGWDLTVAEAEFLAVLAALLKAREFSQYARQVEALMPLEPIDLQWRPDPHWVKNYRIVPFDARAADCLEIVLCRNNLEPPRDEARRKLGFRSGYYVVFGLDWCRDGRVGLILPNGYDRRVPESLYLNVLEQVLALHGLEALGGERV